MSHLLHPHLKRTLDFESCLFKPENGIVEFGAELQEEDERTAKRRRIGIIASRYLSGQRPMILSASLKGPFNNGWKNPWSRGGLSPSPYQRNIDQEIALKQTRGATSIIALTPKVPRTAVRQVEPHLADNSFLRVEISTSTAFSQDEHIRSETNGWPTVENNEFVRECMRLTDPFWLRRSASEVPISLGATSKNDDTNPSPLRPYSRPRNNDLNPIRPNDVDSILKRQCYCISRSPPRITTPTQCTFSSFAVLPQPPRIDESTAPAEPTVPKPVTSLVSHQSLLDMPPSASVHEKYSMAEVNAGAEENPHLPSTNKCMDEDTLRNRFEAVVDDQIDQTSNAKMLVLARSHFSSSVSCRVPEENVGRSAERLMSLMSSPSESEGRNRYSRRRSAKGPKWQGRQERPKHDLVASPAPASSTGFMYRKRRKSKPAAASTDGHSETSQEYVLDKENNPDGDDFDQKIEFSTPNSPYVLSQPSIMSTQAAMFVARLQFQEDTCPVFPFETYRSWLQTPKISNPLKLPGLNPAATPVSVLEAHPDSSIPNQSTVRKPLMSTQDLFGAASPFAFSTIKKKPEPSQRSSLRQSLLSATNEDIFKNNRLIYSPTEPNERTPLKDKNVSSQPQSCIGEKLSQELPIDQPFMFDLSAIASF